MVRSVSCGGGGTTGAVRRGIEEVLLAEGYLDESVRILMRLVADLSWWLGERQLGAADLRTEVIDEFFTGRWRSSLSASVATLAESDRCPLVLVGRNCLERRAPVWPHEGRGRAARGLWQVVYRPARADADDNRPVRRACCGLSEDVASRW